MNFDFVTTPTTARQLGATLSDMEAAQLIRRAADAAQNAELAYLFKHALVQDSAYASLMRHERIRLHTLVATTLEQQNAAHLDENAALLAFHFEQAKVWDKALDYLSRAAEWAHRAVALREEIALLTRALALSEHVPGETFLAALYSRRAKAFAGITRFQDASDDYQKALALVPPTQAEQRAELLVDYAIVQNWLVATAQAKQAAIQARQLAEQTGRQDLLGIAMSTLAMAESIDGELEASVVHFNQAFARAGNLPAAALLQGMEVAGLTQYWLGNYAVAVEQNSEAVQRARAIPDSITMMRGLSNVGMSLVGSGRYGEALATFKEARKFGEAHGLGSWLARQIAIEGGFHLEMFDYAGAEALSLQAKETARAYKFIVSIVSPGVDLIFNYARTGQLHRADRVTAEVIRSLPEVKGSHVWLLRVRFTQARAEVAAARAQWGEALELADESLALSRAHGRVKYEIAALGTRAGVLAHLGRPAAALVAARQGVALARPIGDPAMLVRAAIVELQLQPNDALITEARAAVARIVHALPDARLRSGYQAIVSEWI